MATYYPHLCVVFLSCSFFFIALGSTEQNFVVVPRNSFASLSEPTCTTTAHVTSDPNRATMPLVHRHGPCTPAAASAVKPSLVERLRRDRARRNHVISKAVTLSDGSGSVSIPTYLGDAVDSIEYVVTLGIGTPAVSQVLLIDTGSDLSWVQCKPCNATVCYPQKDPLFDPSASSTYASVPCGSDACKKLNSGNYGAGCTNATGSSQCQFGIQYGGGETTVGVYSTETLTLKPGAAVTNFSYGCGLRQRGEFDKFDGLLGLGGAPESLVSQTAAQYGGGFSYCLPPTGNGSAGFLTLGAPSSNNSSSGFVFVPMHQLAAMPTFYMVTLAGINVGGKQLDIPPAVFSNGMIIDSGTVITALPTTAYSALQSAFRTAMSQYPLLPPNDDLGLDTCYNFTGHGSVTVPKVSLSFSGGATVDLDVPSGVLVEDCLAFLGDDSGVGIIGNVNQRRFEVLYDTAGGKVGFRSGAC